MKQHREKVPSSRFVWRETELDLMHRLCQLARITEKSYAEYYEGQSSGKKYQHFTDKEQHMFTGIGHVAFRVTSLQRALDLYCNKLGFSEAFRLDREGEPSPWIVYIQITPGSFIELFPDLQDASGPLPARDPQASYKHVCLLVDDLSASLRELAARGLEITGSLIQGMDANLQYWIHDPDGNPIELMQIMPDSPQAAADARMRAEAGSR